MLVRSRTIFVGRVQGVGFRFTTVEIARRHDICGQVRNLPDGCVELIAEGQEKSVTQFLKDVEATVDRVTHGQIENAETHFEQIETARFDSYQIVR